MLRAQNQQIMTINIVTESQYTERVMIHIDTPDFAPDNTELTSLFLQLVETIRYRSNPIFITHIRSHMGLPVTLAKVNDDIDSLLIVNVLEASKFHKKHHVNIKGLKKDYYITWQQPRRLEDTVPLVPL